MVDTRDEVRIGDRIGGRFEILGTLGRGGFGVVYHARAMENGREFALKTYLRASEDRRAIARFRQESEVWIALGAHPFLVQAYFADEIDGRLFVGMELIKPGASGHNDLESVLKEGLPALERVLRWSIQLCHGMEYAALRGIQAHRDLKPANVMLNEAEDVKINDFGLATQPLSDLGEAQPTARLRFRGQTMHGVGFGTPTHMPPEQFDNAASCDSRSDIYAVGVILFQMITGTLPVQIAWPEDASLESRMRYWHDMQQAHLRFSCPQLEHPLGRILVRCLATDPADRYPDFARLRADLEAVADQLKVPVPPAPMARELSAKSWLARAKSLCRIGRHAQAIHAAEKCLEREPEREDALLVKAEALLGMDKAAIAQPLFDSILLKHPRHAPALDGKARCLQRRGYPKEALALFDEAVQTTSATPGIRVHRGRLLRELGRSDEARACFERALEQAPLDAEALSAKGAHLLLDGRPSDAMALFERALSIHPLLLEATRGQAMALTALGQLPQAITLFRSLDRSDELHERGRLAWAEALSRSGRIRDALDLLEGVGSSGLQVEWHRIRAQVLLDFKRPDEALLAWKAAHPEQTLDPESSARGQVLLVCCADESGALKLVSSALATEPGHEATCAVACGAALRTGQDEQALQVCEHGLAFHPESAILQYQKGLSLAALQRTQEARSVFSALASEERSPLLIRIWAGHNAGILSGAVPERYGHSGSVPLRTAAELPSASLIPDDLSPVHPRTLAHHQANGWHPRYRMPHLRPPVYLFPRWTPVQLDD